MATKTSSLVLVMTFVLFGLVIPPDFPKMIGVAQTTKNTETEAENLIKLGHQQIDKRVSLKIGIGIARDLSNWNRYIVQ